MITPFKDKNNRYLSIGDRIMYRQHHPTLDAERIVTLNAENRAILKGGGFKDRLLQDLVYRGVIWPREDKYRIPWIEKII